jgi:release factor glutamine methyltransferase
VQPYLLNLINEAANILEKQGIDNAKLEAELLFCAALKIKRTALYCENFIFEELSDQIKLFDEFINRRCLQEPFAYIVGVKEFYGYEFIVNKNVLIPRPDTEILIDNALQMLKDKPLSTIADICTGSGCIAISLALQTPNSIVYATDICQNALNIAKLNCENHNLTERINFYLGNLINPIPKNIKFDLIISNPPYVKQLAFELLEKSIKNFEPRIALLGEGDEGLLHHARILQMALDRLNPKGLVILEIGFDQKEAAEKLHINGFMEPLILYDYASNARAIVFTKI